MKGLDIHFTPTYEHLMGEEPSPALPLFYVLFFILFYELTL